MDDLVKNAFSVALKQIKSAQDDLESYINNNKIKSFEPIDACKSISYAKVTIEEIYKELERKNNG